MNGKKIIGIIQARMGSKRLPNKMMLYLHGYPIIEWVYRRVLQANLLDDVVVAIPNKKSDDILAVYLNGLKAKVFRGEENDLVSRFYLAAIKYNATHVVRVCADNPLICPEEINNLIERYFASGCDYAYNNVPKNNKYPDGLGAEIVSLKLLEDIYNEAKLVHQREHVFDYIWDNQDKYKIFTFNPKEEEIAYPAIKVDIDTYEDYKMFLLKNITINMNAREVVGVFKK